MGQIGQRSKTNKKFMVLSALGIFMVVDSHTWGAFNLFGSYMPYNSFFMPMFVFISGYFNKIDSATDLWAYTRKKLKTLLLPYVIISLVVFGLQFLINWYKLGEIPTIPDGYLSYVLERVVTTGSPFAIAEPLWFALALFATLMVYALLKKFLYKWWNSYVAMVIFTCLHLCVVHVGQTLEPESFATVLLPLKCLFLLPFLELGILYREKLEQKHTAMPGGAKIGLMFLMLLMNAVRTMYLPMPYDLAFDRINELAGFTSPYFVTPLVSSLIGITFWLTFVDLLGKPVYESRFVNYMSCNTFSIMGMHILFFNILNCVLLAIHTYCVDLPYFDADYFLESEWYYWEISPNFKAVYVLVGILGPLGLKWVFDKAYGAAVKVLSKSDS